MTARNQKHIQAVLDLASAGEIAHGHRWYQLANDAAVALADRYEIKEHTAAGVIAALSPRNNWDRNLIDAENLIAAYVAGGAEAAAEVKCCTFGKNKQKAIEILVWSAEFLQVCEILAGPKTTEFFRCIIGETDVCIDGHAYAIWFGDRIPVGKTPKIGVNLRRQIKKDYLAVAKKNYMSGEQLQAITWLAYRRLHGIA